MNSLTRRIATTAESLTSLSNADLLARLEAAFSVTVEKLIEISAIVRLIDDRGIDTSDMKITMLDWYRRIAYGQILPEAFERYRHHPRLLTVICNLPIPDQEKLSRPCSLPVLAIKEGEVDERQVDPIEMTPREVRQVFSMTGVRSLAEQRGYLEDRAGTTRVTVKELESGVTVDRRRKALIINGTRFSRSQLLSYLSHLDD